MLIQLYSSAVDNLTYAKEVESNKKKKQIKEVTLLSIKYGDVKYSPEKLFGAL